MNQAHFHLAINHLPIMGTAIGLIVLLSGYVLKNQVVKRTALGIFILSCFGILSAHFTGEGAEDVVENIPGITKKLIHHHEDYASIFGWCLLGVAILSLLTIYLDLKNKSTSKILYLLIIASAILTLVFAQQTATSGGEIRHTEIRDNAAGQIFPIQEPTGNNEKEHEGEH